MTAPLDRLVALGGTVRQRRREFGLRQDELADLAGCSVRFVHTLEQGKASLRLDKVLDVLEVLGFDLKLEAGTGRITSDDSPPTDATLPRP